MMKYFTASTLALLITGSILGQPQPKKPAQKVSKMALSLRLGGGYGWAMYGTVNDSKTLRDVGIAENSYFIEGAGFFNYDIWATESAISFATFKDPELFVKDTNSDQSSTLRDHGLGSMAHFDQKFGVKLFTEPGDMGFTFFYLSFNLWRTSFERDIEANAQLYTGIGAGIGVRDISTLSLGGISLILHTNIWVGFVPMFKRSQGSSTDNIGTRQSLSGAGELGFGTALENLGIALFINLKGHVHFSEFRLENNPESGNLLGVGGIWGGLQVMKDFNL